MPKFYLIGLTGNLGSGKSTVRRMLEELGALGIDADRLGHVAMLRGTPTWNDIVEAFGTNILHANGKIDRRLLGARVFNDPKELQRLESILHPAVRELIKGILVSNTAPVVVIEAIKLLEANLHVWCDALWVVTASPEVQLQRVMRDRNMRADDARKRLAAQSPQNEKLRLANVVIDNSFDLDSTRTQVQNAWRQTVRHEAARDKDAWLFGNALVPEPTIPVEPAPTSELSPLSVQEEQQGEPFAEPPTSPEVERPADLSANATQIDQQEESPAPAELAAPEDLKPKVEAVQEPSADISTLPETISAPVQTTPTPGTPAVEEGAIQSFPGPESAPSQENIERAPEGTIEVRRARRTDMDTLGIALAKLENRSEPIPRAEMIRRIGEHGYRIALCEGTIVALAAWEVENLVAILRELWAESPLAASRALLPLFGQVEEDARELQCEALIVLANSHTPDYLLDLIRSSDYQTRPLGTLNRIWRQVAEERMQPGDSIWVKRLREDLVTKPI